ncbi:YihY/virulence factor BrkB family protein [Falsirhodobacter algicola]|uniref:YihY family inner membrane protein n=1 Tax=Falsirhodobacter algicola TaxID=2692330 RepID=A0A8J8MRW1_9RHOB|nr:YihY/virulence factor BrkB family protein [Falsirhodobacter algicola]QUS35168.1 YihY family inner membrane protein [Falsirhodobacter algicola]
MPTSTTRTPVSETDPPVGRSASSPVEIPARGWWQIAKRVIGAVMEDRVLAVAAGMTFFLLLAFVPSITAFVSIYGLFADRATVTNHMALLAEVLPEQSLSIVNDQVTRIASTDATTMTFASIFSLLVAMWSANGGVKAMIEALNVAYNEREKRSYVMLNLISMTMMIGGVILILVMIAAVAVLPAVLSFLSIETGGGQTSALLIRWPVIFLVMMATLAGLYRFGPSRRSARWRWISPGAVFASVALVIFSVAFSIYASNFANFNETYGSLGALMGLLMWLWLSSVIVLVGAEINSETEKQVSDDSTVGPDRPMGEREAHAADVIAH